MTNFIIGFLVAAVLYNVNEATQFRLSGNSW